MIYVICSRCGTKHLRGTECPKGCYAKLKKENNRMYDKYIRRNAEFYNSTAWRNLRNVCRIKYNNICVYSYFKHNLIIKSETVHHITELEEDKARSLDINNLIPVSNSAHNEIHSLYRKDKGKIQQELREMLKMWERLFS